MIGLTGLGIYIPEARMTASEIAAESGLPEWVVTEKLGILEKPLPGPQDHPTQMGVRAGELALADAGVPPSEVDVVISITEEFKEYPVWTAGIKLAYDLGADNAYAYDIGQKCGTGVLALKQARDLLRADPSVDTVLIAGGYRNGDLVDFRDPNVRFMYNLAAGGGAAVIQRDRGGSELLEASIRTDGSFSLDVLVPVGGTKEPITSENAGRFRLAVADPQGMKERLERASLDNFVRVAREAVDRSGQKLSDVAYLAMLHVKPSAHAHLLNELGLSPDQAIYLNEYGHMGQIDGFLSLDLARKSGHLKNGDLVLIVAAGVGYVWNAICLRWGEVA